jgi:hypothetical protein
MTAATVRTTKSWSRLGGLAWLTWRQHRFVLFGAVVLLGGFGALMIVNGNAMHADYHRLGLDSCDLTTQRCGTALDIFTHRYQSIADFLPRVILFLPALLGAFVGAPLIARELESGTFRFAWTQGTVRATWARAKLLLLGAALVILALAFTALFTWWFRPFVPILGRMQSGGAYEVEGTVFVARTLFGFTLGAFLGTVIRRTVPAMAATLAAWVGVVLSSVIYLRPHLQSPITAPDSNKFDRQVTRQDWTLQDWFQDKTGHHLSDGDINALIHSQPPSRQGPEQVMTDNGMTHWVQYQPANRFWHFQLLESAGYVALAVALGAATVWWVRRRAA